MIALAVFIAVVINFFILLVTISILKQTYLRDISKLTQKVTNLDQALEILTDEVKVHLIASKPITTSGITVQEFTIPKDKYEFS